MLNNTQRIWDYNEKNNDKWTKQAHLQHFSTVEKKKLSGVAQLPLPQIPILSSPNTHSPPFLLSFSSVAMDPVSYLTSLVRCWTGNLCQTGHCPG